MAEHLVTAKDLAKILSVSLASVNYYTNLGLLRVRDRRGNTRLYEKEEVIRASREIYRLRKEGYSLRLIQRKLSRGYI